LIPTPHRRLDKLPEASSWYLCFDAGYRAAAIQILNKMPKCWPYKGDPADSLSRTLLATSHFFGGLRQPILRVSVRSAMTILTAKQASTHVLVIDDDTVVADTVATVLKTAGFEVR
jgi:hypothetical protein